MSKLPNELQLPSEVRPLGLPVTWPGAVRGGISTRGGGLSTGALAALNLGTRVGDAPENIRRNLSRLSRTTGIDFDRAARIRLEHGSRIVPATAAGVAATADAMVTVTTGLPLAITVADCYPVVLAGSRSGVGIVHAGWRSIAGGIIAGAVAQLRRLSGERAEDLWAWIGPGIGACCFEVSSEVAGRFPAEFVRRGPRPVDRPRVDLSGVLHAQLVGAGLERERITKTGLCTACRADLFYSHRRDRGQTGRMLAYVVRNASGD